jgi:hypothetical protein
MTHEPSSSLSVTFRLSTRKMIKNAKEKSGKPAKTGGENPGFPAFGFTATLMS